ncbi:MAG: hypothetical protein Q7R49_04740 [Candidatus Daviesbacteria bacterium]|nr:hypothetical protein [Candidatus Daviesbacteria bacterium]
MSDNTHESDARIIIDRLLRETGDPAAKQPTGCTYVRWLKPGEVPVSAAGEEPPQNQKNKLSLKRLSQ